MCHLLVLTVVEDCIGHGLFLQEKETDLFLYWPSQARGCSLWKFWVSSSESRGAPRLVVEPRDEPGPQLSVLTEEFFNVRD